MLFPHVVASKLMTNKIHFLFVVQWKQSISFNIMVLVLNVNVPGVKRHWFKKNLKFQNVMFDRIMLYVYLSACI